MPQFSVSLERKISKRTNRDTIIEQFKFMLSRALGGNRNRNWEHKPLKFTEPVQVGTDWVYNTTFTFICKKVVRDEHRLNKEASNIVEYLKQAAESTKYKSPWVMSKPVADWPSFNAEAPAVSEDDAVDFDKALHIEDIVIPDVLIYGSDKEIEQFDAFQGIYGRSQHIRVIASSIKRMKDTNGAKRNHALLFGLPGCAKSHIIKGLKTILGPGGSLTINANSATKAGIERIFLDRFKETGVPPVIFIEEIEKSQEAILTVWLSILDDRAEVIKFTHHKQEKANAKVLAVATANDKILFDRLHGGRPNHPGALSSRFTKQLYIPRPSTEIMKRILMRDVELYGGNTAWVEPCIEIAKELKTNDPRIILGLLDGQDRLLDGSYKDDILSIYQTEKEENQQHVWGDEE